MAGERTGFLGSLKAKPVASPHLVNNDAKPIRVKTRGSVGF